MVLIADGAGGLNGKYYSAVGKAEDFYILTGRYDTDVASDKGTSVGWVVSWRNAKLNAHSTATWSGQYFGGSNETILTQWLLTRSSTADSVWNSTNVGANTFRRSPPNAAGVVIAEEKSSVRRTRNQSLRLWSSPVEYFHACWNKMFKRDSSTLPGFEKYTIK